MTYKMNESHKQYKYLWREMLKDDVIDKAFQNMRKHKTRRPEILSIEANYDEEKEAMREMIFNTRPGPVPHPEKAFRPVKHKAVKRFEHGKWRTTYKPEIHELWLQHIIVVILAPIIMKTAYKLSCGSMPKRGAHYGMRRLRRMIARGGKGLKYFDKLDIRHFFDSIRMKVMIQELAIRIKDEWFLYVIERCYATFKKGLALGFYLSQWLANYLLEPLDRMITEAGFENYYRYVDDMTILGPAKRRLHELTVKIKQFLGQRFRLKLKRNYQVSLFDYRGKGRVIDFMGFLFWRNRVTIRKRILLKATRTARYIARVQKNGRRLFKNKAQAMISYMGWFTPTDSYECYKTRIKPYVSIKRLKQRVSRLDKKENRQYDRMGGGALLLAAG